MQKWEYKISTHSSPWNPEELLRELGNQGWELCSIVRAEDQSALMPGMYHIFTLVLKRLKEEIHVVPGALS